MWVLETKADPRAEQLGLFMMSSPVNPVLLLAAYLYFIYKLGPRLMANRRPFDLRIIIILYNFAQMLVNCFIVYEAVKVILYDIDWDCAPVDYSNDPKVLYQYRIYHVFFLTKMADLLDTVFFVLRKKTKQVTFLHVYHHTGMCMMIWVAIKFFAGGHGVFVGAVNGTVHAVMYCYYMLSAIDEKWKTNITFKKTITQMQMLQFFTFIIIYGRLLFKPDCAYPKFCSYFFVPQNIFMLTLFADFYRKTYLSKKQSPEPLKETFKKDTKASSRNGTELYSKSL